VMANASLQRRRIFTIGAQIAAVVVRRGVRSAWPTEDV